MYRPFKNATSNKISTPFTLVHPAVDWFDKYGTPLVAPEDCVVMGITGEEFTPDNYEPLRRGYGIKLRGNYDWLFWHCQPIFAVRVGEEVKAGQIIGYMGNSGNVLAGGKYVPVEERANEPHSGTHLHLECWNGIVRIDPVPLMTEEPNYTYFEAIKAISITIGKLLNLLKI